VYVGHYFGGLFGATEQNLGTQQCFYRIWGLSQTNPLLFMPLDSTGLPRVSFFLPWSCPSEPKFLALSVLLSSPLLDQMQSFLNPIE